MLTIEKASAGGFCGYDKYGNPLYSSDVCGWVSVAYCAVAGLLAFGLASFVPLTPCGDVRTSVIDILAKKLHATFSVTYGFFVVL